MLTKQNLSGRFRRFRVSAAGPREVRHLGRVGAIDILPLIPKIRRSRHDLSAHCGPRTAGDRATPQHLSPAVRRRPDSDVPGGHYPPRKPGWAATPDCAARFPGTVPAFPHLLIVLPEN